MLTHYRFLVAFHHHSHQRLGTRFAQQYSPATGHLAIHLVTGRLHIGIAQWIDASLEPDVDQDLWALMPGQALLSERLPATTQRKNHLQRSMIASPVVVCWEQTI